MASLRQSILIRTDLNLPLGLMAAQIAHLHFESFRYHINDLGQLKVNEDVEGDKPNMVSMAEMISWMHCPYLFVHQVPNREALEFFEKEAQKAGIQVETWKDTIYLNLSPTFKKAFENVKVGIVLGPCDSDRIKAVISDLPLL